jgi:MFS family permease
MIREYPRNVLLGMGARYIDGVFFNVFAVFSISYIVNTLHLPRTTALWAVCSSAFVMIFFIPFFGHISDKWGRGRTYAVGAILLAISTYPAFWAISSGNVVAIFAALIIPFGIIYAMCYGPEAALFCDLFDARVRYTGISFVYQFSGIFASGITPIIATYLIAANGTQPWYLCAYVVFAALVSAASAMAMKGKPPRLEEIRGNTRRPAA